MNEPRFVTCPACDGYGAEVIGHGRWPDGSENNEEIPCSACDGTGRAETSVEPITMRDLSNTTVCATCRFWSQMCAQSIGGNDIEALCLATSGPRIGKMTRELFSCASWASNHYGQVDDPPDYGERVRALYSAERDASP